MRWVVLALLLCGCPSVEEIVFASTEGSGVGLGACICSYDDGSHGNAAVEVTCAPGNGKIQSVSFFFRPPYGGDEPRGVDMILQVAGRAQSFPGSAVGSLASPGEVEKIGSRSIRPIENMQLSWTKQNVCDVVSGCAVRDEIPAGAMKNGHGGCTDFWAFEK